MKKITQIFLAALMVGYSAFASATGTFYVTPPAVVQPMVVGSTQQLYYFLASPIQSPAFVEVKCTFTSTDPAHLKYSFNNAGCIKGVGLNNGIPPVNGVPGVNTLLTLTLLPGATGPITGTLTFTQVGGAKYTIPYTLKIPVVANSNRTITFKNYCKAPASGVVIGVTSSNVPAKNQSTGNTQCTTNADCSQFTYSTCLPDGHCGGGACVTDSDCTNSNSGTCFVAKGATSATCSYCASDSDCMAGSSCASNNLCYWNLPVPNHPGSPNSPYVLAAPVGQTIDSATIAVTDYSATNGYTLIWGGGYVGRTYCTASGSVGGNDLQYTCKTGGCNTNGLGDGLGGCYFSEGFAIPSTSPEVTYVSQSPDTYDVTLINGPNIGVSMYPTNASSPQAYNNPYLCGSPGNVLPTVTKAGTLGGCSWRYVLPGGNLPVNAFNWVDVDGGLTCPAHTCPSGQACGLTKNLVAAGSGATVCGTLLGHYTQNEICRENSSYNVFNVVNCTDTNLINASTNLFACTGNAGTSCYKVGAASTTCGGCTNWQNEKWNGSYIKVPGNSAVVQQCTYPNPYWTGTDGTGVLSALLWLKEACPSSYTYPFDDASSTFTCPSNAGQSAVNYTVEFCPEEKLIPALS